MRSVASVICSGLLFLLLTEGSSCNRYIDKASGEREIKVAQGSLKIYPDSNILIYKNSVGMKADRQLFMARTFSTPLPKGVKWFEISNSESFVFFYDKGQVISITINLADSSAVLDTAFVPVKSDLNKIIDAIPPGSNNKYDIRNIEFKAERKQLVIRKNAATILLFNIEPRKYGLDSAYLGRFRFL